MTNSYKTPQEEFWAGEFGDEYSKRNVGDQWIANNIALFSKVISRTRQVHSVIEFGANIGLNLRAIKNLLPKSELSAIEINQAAVGELEKLGEVKVYHQSILDFAPARTWDLVLIKGVLIHTNPDLLPDIYDNLYHSCGRYLCVVEYYNPTPVSVNYRGHTERLFKRDFAGEMLDRFKDLVLVDYGFVYHRDSNAPQDDCTWFLMEKQ